MALRRQANSLPLRVRVAPRPQALLIRDWVNERASPALDRWLQRRLSHILVALVQEEAVQLVRIRLRRGKTKKMP